MEPVPTAELTSRVKALQTALAPAGISLALIRQRADLFYYAGTLVDVTSRYTYGISGEKFFRTVKDEGKIMGTVCPDCSRTTSPPRLSASAVSPN